MINIRLPFLINVVAIKFVIRTPSQKKPVKQLTRRSVEEVKDFSWETVRLEFNRHLPTVMLLLLMIVNKPSERIPLMCFIASLLLKC